MSESTDNRFQRAARDPRAEAVRDPHRHWPRHAGERGLYNLMAYTAIGTTANCGARLESVAEPVFPCIGRRTHEEMRDRFRHRPEPPHSVDLKGLGEQR